MDGQIQDEARTVDLDFVVVGAGILGTTTAALASSMGYRVLVLRLHDLAVPRADTLRNQGWLQSGVFYRITDFPSEKDYRVLALKTYFGGRRMVEECGMAPSTDRGVVRVRSAERREDLE